MTRAYVVHPVMSAARAAGSRGRDGEGPPRSAAQSRAPENRLREALGLTEALSVEIVGSELTPTPVLRAATLFGSGKVSDLGERFKDLETDIVVVDAPLTPLQQRNLERAWKVKVLDRTGLILEIFGDRAQTREGVLQVELAHLAYQKSRLVRSWTHLERQRGGVGFMGGPGETQIESDRRQLAEKISRLEKKIEKVARTRSLHRRQRAKAPQPVIALVGYTNAGKSTLFNRLTEAEVMAKDMLFATLDPTMRAIAMPGGREAVMSDTVGFISDLPTELVAAFRATLEEVLSADIIVHVRDISDAETEAQRADVLEVLSALGLDVDAADHVLEAWNKIDLLAPDARRAARNACQRDPNAVCLSAVTGEGVEDLLVRIEARLSAAAVDEVFVLAPQDGAAIAWLYGRGAVVSADAPDESGRQEVLVRLTPSERGQFEKRFGAPSVITPRAEENWAAAE